jgi:triosephosphate isomerase
MRRLVAGNWKMNGDGASLGEIEAMAGRGDLGADLWIAPPATLIHRAAAVAGPVVIGAQDCHPAQKGAHTGDLSAGMLREAGARFAIVGHSERRQDHGEDDAAVRAKAEAALGAGLTAVVCVGETEAEREAGRALEVVRGQIEGSLPEGDVVVAYEPVWAIGTGRVPTTEQIGEMHAAIRERVGPGVRLLYGGSVKPANAAEIAAVGEVDGALVGGASLKAADLAAIAEGFAGA